jgi:hypothetical protein
MLAHAPARDGDRARLVWGWFGVVGVSTGLGETHQPSLPALLSGHQTLFKREAKCLMQVQKHLVRCLGRPGQVRIGIRLDTCKTKRMHPREMSSLRCTVLGVELISSGVRCIMQEHCKPNPVRLTSRQDLGRLAPPAWLVIKQPLTRMTPTRIAVPLFRTRGSGSHGQGSTSL